MNHSLAHESFTTLAPMIPKRFRRCKRSQRTLDSTTKARAGVLIPRRPVIRAVIVERPHFSKTTVRTAS